MGETLQDVNKMTFSINISIFILTLVNKEMTKLVTGGAPIMKEGNYKGDGDLRIDEESEDDKSSVYNVLENDNEQCIISTWYDYKSNHKKVIVVYTLPSGTNPKKVKVKFGDDDESGVTDYITVNLPWNETFMDADKIFPEYRENIHHPVKDAYRDAMKNKLTDKHNKEVMQKLTFRLPIMVQKDFAVTENMQVGFTSYERNGKKMKQYVLKIMMTGVLDRYSENQPVIQLFDSDDDNHGNNGEGNVARGNNAANPEQVN